MFLDADPQGVNPATSAAYWPTATRGAVISMTPGATSPGTITLPSTKLQFTRSELSD